MSSVRVRLGQVCKQGVVGSSPIVSTDVVRNTTFRRERFPLSHPTFHWHFPTAEDPEARILPPRRKEAWSTARDGDRTSAFVAGLCPTHPVIRDTDPAELSEATT